MLWLIAILVILFLIILLIGAWVLDKDPNYIYYEGFGKEITGTTNAVNLTREFIKPGMFFIEINGEKVIVVDDVPYWVEEEDVKGDSQDNNSQARP